VATRFLCALALPLTLLLTPPGRALSAELGFDGGAVFQIFDEGRPHVITVGIPTNQSLGVFTIQALRVGFPITQSGQLEPAFGFWLQSQEQSDGSRRSLAHLLAGLSFLQSTQVLSRTAPYVRGGASLRVLSGTGLPAIEQIGLVGGLGMRWHASNTLGSRTEGSSTRWFSNSDVIGHWDLGLTIGLSVYTN
jgi:hypothetical protein